MTEARRSVFSSQQIEGLMLAAMAAHVLYPRTPDLAYRQFDGMTPVALHTVYCATMVTQEAALPVELRRLGFEVLLFHDLEKDTTASYPVALSDQARRLIEAMTYGDLDQQRFFTSLDEEMQCILNARSADCRLFMLYAKVGNLWDDADWMAPDQREQYLTYVLKLAEKVEGERGELGKKLRIISVARCLCAFRAA